MSDTTTPNPLPVEPAPEPVRQDPAIVETPLEAGPLPVDPPMVDGPPPTELPPPWLQPFVSRREAVRLSTPEMQQYYDGLWRRATGEEMPALSGRERNMLLDYLTEPPPTEPAT